VQGSHSVDDFGSQNSHKGQAENAERSSDSYPEGRIWVVALPTSEQVYCEIAGKPEEQDRDYDQSNDHCYSQRKSTYNYFILSRLI
jgi:hypothetical protein